MSEIETMKLQIKLLQEQVKTLFVVIEQQRTVIEHTVATMTILTDRVVDGR